MAFEMARETVDRYLEILYTMRMSTIPLRLRPLRREHTQFFERWWRDPVLIRLTSGRSVLFSDRDIERSVSFMMKNTRALHRMVVVNHATIGHMSLVARPRKWWEIQIVIGERRYWSKGYGTRAIRAMLRLARRYGIRKIYLDVRPTNHRAICAYERAGFVRKAIRKHRDPILKETLRMEYIR